MGKSPAKWIKTVLFGKKSSKSSFSKGTTIQEKASLTAKLQTGDLAVNSPVITDQTRQVTGIRGENELEKGTSMDMDEVLPASINENISIGLILVDEHELAKLEEAATRAQASFRGYLARRAFRALKGIIRLQALVRGHLVRRQAVATLRCMQSIIKLQSLVRGRKVRVSDIGLQVLKKDSLVDFVGVAKFVRAEKLSRNVFVTKLVASLPNAMPLSLQYDVVEQNSAEIWLERWSISRFWEPLTRQKKIVDPKPKRKQSNNNNTHTEDSDKPKHGIWKVPTKLNDTSSESEKPKRVPRKVPILPTEPDPPQIELEKVKRNLRKVSVSAAAASDKPEPVVPEKPFVSLKKVSTTSPTHDLTVKPKSKSTVPAVIETTSEEKLLEDMVAVNENLTDPTTEIPSQEVNGKVNSGPIESEPVAAKEEHGSSGKENLKTRRRRSLPVKAELTESVPQSGPTVPSYMAATESAKAKLRAQETLRLAEEGIENGSVRRYSLPTSANGKMNTPSPRVQKPLVNGKSGGNKSGRLVVSAAKDGWKR